MKHLSRTGEVIERSGDDFEDAMDNIVKQYIAPRLLACVSVGLGIAVGVTIFFVRVANWFMR